MTTRMGGGGGLAGGGGGWGDKGYGWRRGDSGTLTIKKKAYFHQTP
jgi:hypothetical protein